MRKFAIEITKGNDTKIVSTHETKEEAMAAGEKIDAELGRHDGLVSCICADFDENNDMIGTKYRLYEVWG